MSEESESSVSVVAGRVMEDGLRTRRSKLSHFTVPERLRT